MDKATKAYHKQLAKEKDEEKQMELYQLKTELEKDNDDFQSPRAKRKRVNRKSFVFAN